MKIKTIIIVLSFLVFNSIEIKAAEISPNIKEPNGLEKQVQTEETDLTSQLDSYISIDENIFPDSVFRDYLRNEFDTDGDNRIYTNSINEISVSLLGIKSLKGIESFPNLEKLICSVNNITNLDLKNNKNLKYLDCSVNQINYLDLSNNAQLEYLVCSENNLETLNLNNQIKLNELFAKENRIKSLTLNGCNSLEYVQVEKNLIDNIDLSACYKLRYLNISNNELSHLELNNNLDIEELYLDNNNISSLDLMNCPELIILYLTSNQVSNLDLSKNQNLQELFVGENQLTSLNLESNPNVTQLFCHANNLAFLDLTNQKDIYLLSLSDQLINMEAKLIGDEWVIPISEYIPKKFWNRLIFDENYTFDLETGQLILPNNKVQKFKYTCKTIENELSDNDKNMVVNVNVDYENDGNMFFTDIESTDWFYESVKYVYDNGLMTGLNETTFGPYENLARAQFAVILHRMNGSPDIEYTNKFPDVADNQWYTDAILWANEAGVVGGYTDTGKFGPGDNINREQMAVMMYRYANYLGYDTSARADISKYTDAGNVNEFAKEAMSWAVGEGIITGKYNETQLDPQGNASRAECATIIMRFMEYYK